MSAFTDTPDDCFGVIIEFMDLLSIRNLAVAMPKHFDKITHNNYPHQAKITKVNVNPGSLMKILTKINVPRQELISRALIHLPNLSQVEIRCINRIHAPDSIKRYAAAPDIGKLVKYFENVGVAFDRYADEHQMIIATYEDINKYNVKFSKCVDYDKKEVTTKINIVSYEFGKFQILRKFTKKLAKSKRLNFPTSEFKQL